MKKKSLTVAAIIPARGGSKGLPRKNIKNLGGKPLIAWSIETALKSRYLNEVIVSTDDREIALTARKYGAAVIDRPKHLATDAAPVMEAIKHCLEELKKIEHAPDVIMILQPTQLNKRTGRSVQMPITYGFLTNTLPHCIAGGLNRKLSSRPITTVMPVRCCKPGARLRAKRSVVPPGG